MTERIAKLKPRAFDNGKHRDWWTTAYIIRKALWEYRFEDIHNIKRAKMDAYKWENIPIEIDPDELLVGRFPYISIGTEVGTLKLERPYIEIFENELIDKELPDIPGLIGVDAGEWERLRQFERDTISLSGSLSATTGHRAPDYDKLLRYGCDGILEEVRTKRTQLTFGDPLDAKRDCFYEACEISLKGFIRFGERYREKLEQLYMAEKEPKRKREYAKLVDIFTQIPAKPARDFYEAIQCVWLLQWGAYLAGDTNLAGRPAEYLYPYYKRDKERGVLDDAFAMELIESYFLKHNEIYDTWPASLIVGGVTREGKPAWNELCYMFIRGIETVGLINPAVAVAYNRDMPQDLLELCVDIISKGYTKPALFSDDVVIAGLVDAGVAIEDARSYTHSTCVEITTIASSNIRVKPFINPVKALELALNNGNEINNDEEKPSAKFLFRKEKEIIDAKNWMDPSISYRLDSVHSYEEFERLVKKCLSGYLKEHVKATCRDALKFSSYCSSPIISCFTNDCIARGLDASAGGAKYNFDYACFPGFLTLADAMTAIKKVVYDERRLTIQELAEAIKNNFSGQENLRQYLLNRCPKFGNDDDYADTIAVDFYNFIDTELSKYCMDLPLSTFHPSYFAWKMHGIFGERTAATPDGRLAGTAMSECLAAVQGRDRHGPFAVARSMEKIEQKRSLGGIASNFRFSQSFIGTSEGKAAVAQFIRYFMENGNFEVQFNVVSQKDLVDAQKHPENYKTLMVRVAGYSDYFTNLETSVQNEIINRLEHGSV